jgi:hypothetical protein
MHVTYIPPDDPTGLLIALALGAFVCLVLPHLKKAESKTAKAPDTPAPTPAIIPPPAPTPPVVAAPIIEEDTRPITTRVWEELFKGR